MTVRKILLIGAAGLLLAGCNTVQGRYAGTGALVGGATGAAIGGLASGSSGALAGAAIGAGTGALIGAAAAPKECYVRNPAGRLVRVRC
ncbi:MAG: glycine zipper domain-containing protein [Pseudorhodoplanes sp.]